MTVCSPDAVRAVLSDSPRARRRPTSRLRPSLLHGPNERCPFDTNVIGITGVFVKHIIIVVVRRRRRYLPRVRQTMRGRQNPRLADY